MTTTSAQTAIQQEAADTLRVKKAKESIDYYKQKEAEAISQLASVRASLKNARERHEQIFMECERLAGERRRMGLIENSSQY